MPRVDTASIVVQSEDAMNGFKVYVYAGGWRVRRSNCMGAQI